MEEDMASPQTDDQPRSAASCLFSPQLGADPSGSEWPGDDDPPRSPDSCLFSPEMRPADGPESFDGHSTASSLWSPQEQPFGSTDEVNLAQIRGIHRRQSLRNPDSDVSSDDCLFDDEPEELILQGTRTFFGDQKHSAVREQTPRYPCCSTWPLTVYVCAAGNGIKRAG